MMLVAHTMADRLLHLLHADQPEEQDFACDTRHFPRIKTGSSRLGARYCLFRNPWPLSFALPFLPSLRSPSAAAVNTPPSGRPSRRTVFKVLWSWATKAALLIPQAVPCGGPTIITTSFLPRRPLRRSVIITTSFLLDVPCGVPSLSSRASVVVYRFQRILFTRHIAWLTRWAAGPALGPYRVHAEVPEAAELEHRWSCYGKEPEQGRHRVCVLGVGCCVPPSPVTLCWASLAVYCPSSIHGRTSSRVVAALEGETAGHENGGGVLHDGFTCGN